MRLTLATIGLTTALVVLAFCVVGFLATFEPPGWPALRTAYGLGMVAAIGGFAWIVRWIWKG